MTSAAERDARILAYVAERKYSYAVIAELCGTTRNAVGGVVFRAKHPRAKLITSPGHRSPNMTGKGWQPAEYRPEKTAQSTR